MHVLRMCIVFAAGMAAGWILSVLLHQWIQGERKRKPSPVIQIEGAKRRECQRMGLALGLLWTLFFVACKQRIDCIALCFLSLWLMMAAWIDMKTKCIPEVFSMGLMIMGLCRMTRGGMLPETALQGILVIGGFLFFLGGITGGFGGGDIKFLISVGCMVGLEGGMSIMFFSLLFCLIAELPGGKRKDKVPLGPYLVVGTLLYFGKRMVS